jgi:hypothetical protein
LGAGAVIGMDNSIASVIIRSVAFFAVIDPKRPISGLRQAFRLTLASAVLVGWWNYACLVEFVSLAVSHDQENFR